MTVPLRALTKSTAGCIEAFTALVFGPYVQSKSVNICQRCRRNRRKVVYTDMSSLTIFRPLQQIVTCKLHHPQR